MLLKHRLASTVCVIALALGIGANAAIFSLAEAFLLHPVPFDNADRVMVLADSRPQQDIVMNAVAPATYFDWKREARSFDQFAAYAWREINLTGDGQPEKIQAFAVTANLFATIGVTPQLGRVFLPEEEEPGKNQEMVLSQPLWKQRYGSDPQAVGKTVRVDGRTFTIVGVMGEGFDFPLPAEAWIPLALEPKERLRRDERWLWVLGRLAPGVSFSEASAEMQSIADRQAEAYRDTNQGWRLRPLRLPEFVTPPITRQYILLMMAAVGFVLLIACADVANVQFARVTGRSSEFALRTALGGTRSRLVQQLLIETLLLSVAGAALGLVFARGALAVILANMPPDVAKYVAGWKTIRLDGGVFLFTLLVVVISGILSGILPSLLSSRAHLTDRLKEGGRGGSEGRNRHRLRGALVVTEIALALVLLVGAGLLVENFQGLSRINEQYRPEAMLTLNFTLPETQYANPALRLGFHEQVLARIASLPGVESASLVTHVPYSEGGDVGSEAFSIEGYRPLERGEPVRAILETAAPNYLRQLQIEATEGRLLTDSDGAEGAKVAVVSESLVRHYFPGENPVGRRIKIGGAEAASPWMTIVGVVKDVRYSWIVKQDVPTIYRPYRQAPPYYTTLVLRTETAPLSLVSAVRREIAAVDPNLPLYNVKSLDKVIRESIVGIAYMAVMMAVLGLIALVLASVGVFGVMSYAVSERVHEIGVRLSFGARTRDILGMVLASGMRLTLLGLGIGFPVALLLARGLSAVLFGVKAVDFASFVGLPALLALVSALACYLPARRAAAIDPLNALRIG
jgi:putative ABC transport system permease protein